MNIYGGDYILRASGMRVKFSGFMKILATRNLRRGLALGLPSGQAVAKHFGIAPMTAAKFQ